MSISLTMTFADYERLNFCWSPESKHIHSRVNFRAAAQMVILRTHPTAYLLIILNIETNRNVTTKNTKCNSRIDCNSFSYHTSLLHLLSSSSFIHTVIKNDFAHSVDKSSILIWQLLFYNEVKGYYWLRKMDFSAC